MFQAYHLWVYICFHSKDLDQKDILLHVADTNSRRKIENFSRRQRTISSKWPVWCMKTCSNINLRPLHPGYLVALASPKHSSSWCHWISSRVLNFAKGAVDHLFNCTIFRVLCSINCESILFRFADLKIKVKF